MEQASGGPRSPFPHLGLNLPSPSIGQLRGKGVLFHKGEEAQCLTQGWREQHGARI